LLLVARFNIAYQKWKIILFNRRNRFPYFFILGRIDCYTIMPDPSILSDPNLVAIYLNLISTGICVGLSKAKNKIFRHEDITGFLNLISFSDRIERETEFEGISTTELKKLDTFIVSEPITEIISEIYADTKKTPTEIEDEFIRVFCEVKPIGELSTDEFARKLFLNIRLASNALLNSKIMDGDLLAHEYKSQQRQNETMECLGRIEQYTKSIYQAQTGAISSFLPTEKIDTELKESVELINSNQLVKARNKIFEVIGVLKNVHPENKILLSKAYHLLAVTFNRNKQVGGDFDIAEYYARCALDYNPTFDKAMGGLASILLNKHGKENYEKSFGISAPLWEKSDKTNPQFLEVYLWGIFFTQSADDAIRFFESSKNAQDVVQSHDILSNVVARFYLEIGKPRESLKHINNSIALKKDFPDHFAIKASAYRQISLMEDWLLSDFEVCPRLKTTKCLEQSVINYEICLSLCKENRDDVLQESVKNDLYSSLIILNQRNYGEIFQLRSSINPMILSESDQKRLGFFDFIFELNFRNFSTSYNRLIALKDWNEFPYRTKVNIAVIFLKRGSPEYARRILKPLEIEAEKQKDIQFWIILSYCEALLNNKVGLLQQLNKAKSYSEGSDSEESIYCHFHSMIHRYRAGGKETDRMLLNLQEHDQKFQQQKILKAIPVSEQEEKPPKEIIDWCKAAFEEDQRTKKIFTEHQVPSYILAEVHRLIYPELMIRLKDPNFLLRYHPPDLLSQQELINNFDNGESFVFDYSSLLNLAKMDLLWELEKIPRKLLITTSLFNQIQSDLVSYEDKDLRKLWDFIRSTGKITIVDIDIPPGKHEELSKNLNKWIVDSYELVTILDKSVLLSDDYNLIRLMKSLNCKGTTTYTFLKMLLENGNIDPKTYGVALGVLADQMYVILPFDGEDLFYVVIDDDCKITIRSYHLINHITIPEIRPSIYTQQFEYFLEKIWRTGALPEDKLNWIALISERIVFAINQRRQLNQNAEAEILLVDLIRIWQKIIPLCNLSDISILETKCYPFIEKESSKRLLGYLQKIINQKKDELSQTMNVSTNNSGE
jgi:hypothetical protein